MSSTDWRETFRKLNIDTDEVEREIEEAVKDPAMERRARKEFAKQNPWLRAEFEEPRISSDGVVTLRVLFDPDEIADEQEVKHLTLNDVDLVMPKTSPGASTRASQNGLRVEWVIQGRIDPKLVPDLRRSTSYSLEGRLGGNRTFSAFHSSAMLA